MSEVNVSLKEGAQAVATARGRETGQGNAAVSERAPGDAVSIRSEDFKRMARALIESRAVANT